MIKRLNFAAVVLCGGLGSRIRGITKNIIPKSLVKVYGKPIIWYVVSSLLRFGVDKIIFPIGFKGEKIRNYLKKEFKQNYHQFIVVKTGIDTEIINRIKKIINLLNKYDFFICTNSDTLFDFDLKKFLNFHCKNKFMISLSCIKMKTAWGSLIIENNTNKLKRFVKYETIDSYQLKKYPKYKSIRNSGVSIINTTCLNSIKNSRSVDFENFLYNKFAKKKKVGSLLFDNFWYPIENIKDYNELIKNYKLKKKVNLLKKKLDGKKR